MIIGDAEQQAKKQTLQGSHHEYEIMKVEQYCLEFNRLHYFPLELASICFSVLFIFIDPTPKHRCGAWLLLSGCKE